MGRVELVTAVVNAGALGLITALTHPHHTSSYQKSGSALFWLEKFSPVTVECLLSLRTGDKHRNRPRSFLQLAPVLLMD
jgi:hypothetical protein